VTYTFILQKDCLSIFCNRSFARACNIFLISADNALEQWWMHSEYDRCAASAFVLLRLWKTRSLTIACCSHSRCDLAQQSQKAGKAACSYSAAMLCLTSLRDYHS